MNKNIASSTAENNQSNLPNRNNINIQINFNMKDKVQGFVGKKIDNFVEIEQKIPVKKQSNTKNSDSVTKMKKKPKDTLQKQVKIKNDNASADPKIFERTKNIINVSNQKTPERRSISRKERSKSTNNKVMNKKNSKSVQNIRAIKFMRNKQKSPVSSQSKSRSHSKSSKKLIKNQKQSMKSLYTFTNATLKNKMNKSKISNSRQRQMSGTNKNKQESNDKLKSYMQEKKRKEKIQRVRVMRQQKMKKQKKANQLKKVQIQRKANASKSFAGLKKKQQRQQRYPMYFMDDQDEFQQESSYNQLRKQAQQIIHNSPPPSSYIQAMPIKKINFSEKNQNQSFKKQSKSTKALLVHKYLNGTISAKQLEQLSKNIIKIQSLWRGYISRKKMFRKLSDQSTRIRYIKNKIDNKRGAFWNEQQNSIIKIQKDSNIHIYDSGQSSSNIINFNSNINSAASNNSNNLINALSGTKLSNDKLKRLSIQLQDDIIPNFQSDKSKDKNEDNQKIMKELQDLKKQLEKQNQKFRSLQNQNLNLKENIKILSLKESRQLIIQKDSDNFNSTDYIEIRMPKKIESPIIKQGQKMKIQKSSQSQSTNQFLSNEKQSIGLNSFKKQFQSFECSSPSNARIQQQLKILKHKNIEGIFRKKQLKIQQKYQRKAQMFNKMLNDKLFSPKTFAVKKKQLQSKLQQQKSQIKARIQQAKRVVVYIEDISQLQQQDLKQNQQKQHNSSQQQVNFRKIGNPIVSFNRKQSHLIDSFTNTSPLEQKPIQFGSNSIKKTQVISIQNNIHTQSSQQQRIYKKYWADDIEDVIRQSNQIKRKVDEAIRAQKQASAHQNQNNLTPFQFMNPLQTIQSQQRPDLQNRQQKTVSQPTLQQTYEKVSQQSQIQKKAQQIFNKIDLSDQIQCNSQQQDDLPRPDIADIKDQTQNSEHTSGQNKKVENLFISQIQFNKKKRKEEELSRSSSFDKSNKSVSVNNSHVQSKGFTSNLTFIKQFCITICQFIRNHAQYKQNFVTNVSEPIRFDLFEYLKSYRTTISGQIENNYNTLEQQYMYPYFKVITNKVQPIGKELFEDFLRQFQQEKNDNPVLNGPILTKKIQQMKQIFMISIIDAFNEALQYERPASVYGESFPWMQQYNSLKNYKNLKFKTLAQQKYNSTNSDQTDEYTDEQMRLDQIFGSSIAKIIQWGSSLCGFIADPNCIEMGDSGVAALTDSQLNSIRQNRIGLMLQKWLLQHQQKIIDCSFEYTQVLLCLGQKIINILLLECAEQLSEFEFADILDD